MNGDTSFLFTGDAELEEELDMVYSGMDLKSNVYCVAHHGSYTSTCKELLKAVQPETAVISCGIENTYGHPHEETMCRLKESGIQVYRTDIQGTVTAVSDGNNIIWNKEPCNDYSSDGQSVIYETRSVPVVTDELPVQEEQDYVLNKRSKKFHYPWCKSVDDMSEKNKEFYHGSREELVDLMKYDPCHNCNP